MNEFLILDLNIIKYYMRDLYEFKNKKCIELLYK